MLTAGWPSRRIRRIRTQDSSKTRVHWVTPVLVHKRGWLGTLTAGWPFRHVCMRFAERTANHVLSGHDEDKLSLIAISEEWSDLCELGFVKRKGWDVDGPDKVEFHQLWLWRVLKFITELWPDFQSRDEHTSVGDRLTRLCLDLRKLHKGDVRKAVLARCLSNCEPNNIKECVARPLTLRDSLFLGLSGPIQGFQTRSESSRIFLLLASGCWKRSSPSVLSSAHARTRVHKSRQRSSCIRPCNTTTYDHYIWYVRGDPEGVGSKAYRGD